jgi:ABC-type uncharacterized transport system substrate-binding protein
LKVVSLTDTASPAALDLILKLRVSVWPKTAIVFAAVDEGTAAKKLPTGITGTAIKMTLADLVSTAKTLLPDFKRFAIVGDPFERQLYFRNFVDELPKYSRDLEFIDLMGLPLEKVRQRVATLPAHTVIFYIGINVDRERKFNSAAQVAPFITEVANRGSSVAKMRLRFQCPQVQH